MYSLKEISESKSCAPLPLVSGFQQEVSCSTSSLHQQTYLWDSLLRPLAGWNESLAHDFKHKWMCFRQSLWSRGHYFWVNTRLQPHRWDIKQTMDKNWRKHMAGISASDGTLKETLGNLEFIKEIWRMRGWKLKMNYFWYSLWTHRL